MNPKLETQANENVSSAVNKKLTEIIRETLIINNFHEKISICKVCKGIFSEENVLNHIEVSHPSVITAIEKAFEEGNRQMFMHINKHKIGEMIDETEQENLEGFFNNIFKGSNQDGINNKEVG